MIPRSAQIAILILLAALLIAPVSAGESIVIEDVSAWNIEDTDDLTISSVRLGNCPPGSQQSVQLDAYGEVYTIGVVSSQNWGYWDFNISCTYPNGTTAYREITSFAPYAFDYDLTIQKYFLAADWLFDVDVNVALLPLTVEFESDLIKSEYDALAFSSVTGTSSDPIHVTAYFVTWEEFKSQRENDLGLKIGVGAQDLFNWAWDGVLPIVGKIPYVGEHLEPFLLVTGFALEETAFWLYLFLVEYPELTFGMVEFLIICDALLNTRTLWKLLERIVDDHVKFAEFLLKLIMGAIDMITRILSAVAAIINSIKPL